MASPTTVDVSPRDDGKPATIYDVAKAAGVSHQTVARYLRGYQGIRPATRERVVAALEELDYRPNLTARSLTTGRSHRIGALTHEIDKHGPSNIAQGAAAAARRAGYVLDIFTLDMGDPGSIRDTLDLLRQHDLAGILALTSTDEMSAAIEAARFTVPVYLGGEPDDTATEHSELTGVGFPALVDHLAELGHSSFLHVAGPATWPAARNRTQAYQEALAARGLHSAGIVAGDWTARSGHDAVAALGPHLDASAIVAANDQMALGAMLALRRQGLDVPRDISVTGVDDIPDAAYFAPPLTTLRIDFAAQGRDIVGALLAQIDGRQPERSVTPHSELVVRESTGRARADTPRP
ncbi:LacI family DNA-binding transcriptional regulator [Myceligenerans indicum]|uniref:LacI family transcriptional regulator n=1 Tax=Myceligenerans indicum TaxID=2593663 RepID=A0ABS1LG47_9MICO|nr:LacI family DNA-binding transcriptional regulator [Myceligenerans indicum]MBL0885211.1 LacI family transcriptional regulator [Myceligenerans indicum]